MWARLCWAIALVIIALLPVSAQPVVRFQDTTVIAFGDTHRTAQSWGAITVIDYDRDGDDDVLLHSHLNTLPSQARLMRNNGNGTFSELPSPFPIPGPDTKHRHVWLACDYNLNGVDDMIIATGNTTAGHDQNSGQGNNTRDLWMRNDTAVGGTPKFTDMTTRLGTGDRPSNQWAGTCFDYQNDGDLDVLWAVADMRPDFPEFDAVRLWVKTSRGWRLAARTSIGQNDGQGAGEAASREPYSLDCGDFEGDGDQDCLTAGVNEWPFFQGRFLGYALYNCEGGAPVYELCSYLPGATQSSYQANALLGEFTGDGKLDAYVAETAGDFGLWSERTGRLRLTWSAPFDRGPDGQGDLVGGAVAGDFDNDGDLDLFHLSRHSGMTCDYTWSAKGPDFLWINDGSGRFSNAFVGSGLDGFLNQCGPDLGEGVTAAPGAGGVVVMDYDLDGRLDLIVGYNDMDHQGPFRVYRNVQSTGNAWIGLRLRSPSRSSPLGTKVEARQVGQAVWRTSFLTARTAWLSQSSRNVHLGLGRPAVSGQVEVRITWPNGAVQTVTLPAGTYHIVHRP